MGRANTRAVSLIEGFAHAPGLSWQRGVTRDFAHEWEFQQRHKFTLPQKGSTMANGTTLFDVALRITRQHCETLGIPPVEHSKDADCTVDPSTHECHFCHVIHGEPCPECGGRAYHNAGCSYMDEPGLIDGLIDLVKKVVPEPQREGRDA